MKPNKIFITGEPSELKDRLPQWVDGRPIEWIISPVIEIHPLHPALEFEKNDFDWLIFSSKKTVELWPYETHSLESMKSVQVACIGPKTAETAKTFGWDVSFVPNQSGTEGFLAEFDLDKEASALFAGAKFGRKSLLTAFQNAGWKTSEIALYETKAKILDGPAIKHKIQQADILFFTSPSSFQAVKSICEIPNIPTACLGDYTAEELRRHGIEPKVIPPGDYTKVSEIIKELK